MKNEMKYYQKTSYVKIAGDNIKMASLHSD